MHGQKIAIFRHFNRRTSPWQVCFRDAENKRRSRFFATEAEAKIYRDARRTELRNFGVHALSLPDSARMDAQRGLEMLRPFDKTLLDAVRHYTAHLERTSRSSPLEDLIEKFLWDKQAQQVSASHLYDLRKRLTRFAAAFPAKVVSTFEPDEISEWIHGLRLSPQTKTNYRRILHSFFAYAARRRYADNNPVAFTPRIRVPEHEVVIYSPEEIAKLLSHADPYVVPFLALGAFAGIRRAELLRLKWSDVRLTTGHIFIGAHIAKTGSQRVIPISGNLRAWLEAYAACEGKVVPDDWKRRILTEQACEKAGVRWKHNGLRHSFGTYRLAETQDLGKTAVEMGNSPSVLQKHYRHLVTTEEAKKFWEIRPAFQTEEPDDAQPAH